MSKLSLLAAGSIGFLLGSRAGHAPYEKTAEAAKAKVTGLTSGGSNPNVPAGYGDDAAPQGAI